MLALLLAGAQREQVTGDLWLESKNQKVQRERSELAKVARSALPAVVQSPPTSRRTGGRSWTEPRPYLNGRSDPASSFIRTGTSSPATTWSRTAVKSGSPVTPPRMLERKPTRRP